MRAKRTMIVAIGLLVILAGSPVPSVESLNVRIVDSDGKLFGTLQSVEQGRALSLIQASGSELRVGTCADETKQRVSSPDNAIYALVSERDCGATVDFASRVVLVDGEGQTLVVALEGRPIIKLLWKDGKRLEVHHSRMDADQVYQSHTKAHGVAIIYTSDLDPVEPSKYLDFASVNFAATGRAAGMPRELLERIAGWSQEASGLYRREWGTWTGPSPYGDDPRGRGMVLQGIEYYEMKYGTRK